MFAFVSRLIGCWVAFEGNHSCIFAGPSTRNSNASSARLGHI